MTPKMSPPRPILIDLFCGGGCAAYGYIDAGFHVIGIDNKPHPNYPGEFILCDWKVGIAGTIRNKVFYHASPPCQGYSKLKGMQKNKSPMLIPEVRKYLIQTGRPYVIEGVPGSPLINYIKLNGPMFGLKLVKERWFESNIFLLSPPRIPVKGKCFVPTYGIGKTSYMSIIGCNFNNKQGISAMQIPGKMTNKELAEGIPPAYTKFIGLQLIDLPT